MFALLWLLVSVAAGQELTRPRLPAEGDAPRSAVSSRRPRIGLALGGGGARGVAHVGVLKALEELGIRVDYIAGTSMGAVVGGLYASGMSADEVERVFLTADWRYLLSDAPPRESQSMRSRQRDFDLNQNLQLGISRQGEVQLPAGLIAGRKLLVNLREFTLPVRNIENFNRLPIPFRAIATDLETGEKVVLDRGDLAEAMRASMAVPGVFTPYRIGDRLLVDGGLASNLPIETVRAMGADVVIAVDVRPDLLKEKDLTSAIAVTNQMLDILLLRETEAQVRKLGGRDVYIRLPLPGASSAGFLTSAENIPAGYQETMRPRRRAAGAGRQRRLRPPAGPPPARGAAAARREWSLPSCRWTRLPAWCGAICREKIPFRAGERLEFSALDRYLVGLEGMRGYEVVDFRIVEEDGAAGLLLKTRKKSGSPNYLHLGAELAYGTPSNATGNLLFSWRMTELNRLGAEWETFVSLGDFTRVLSEWYQPVTPGRHFFLAPMLRYAGQRIDAEDADGERRRFSLQTFTIGLDAGVRLGQIGELRLGYEFGGSRISRTLGLEPELIGTARRGELHASLALDTLDRAGFSREGWFARADLNVSDPAFGARDTYGRLALEVFKPLTFGKNTLVPRVTAGLRLGGNELPYYDRFPLGGFLNLSGFTRADLYDQNALLAELIYYRQIAALPPGFGGGLYGGFSVEAGNVWRRLRDVHPGDVIYGGSVFLGADTLLGPLYLGVGAAESGSATIYLQLSPAFGRGRLER